MICTHPQVAYRTVQHALTEKQNKLKKLLDIPDEKTAEHAQEMHDRITDYFRQTGAKLNIDSVKRVCYKKLKAAFTQHPFWARHS